MSNKVSTHLYDLIKSLSKSEKRYFKVLSTKHVIGEENKYMLLFDFIDQMPSYDEGLIIEHFKGEAFLNKFSITKARLYDHILKSLEQFHSSGSVDAQLFSLMNCVDILRKKTLYDQAKKLLRSAEKIAVKNHRYAILMEISLKKKKLLENQNYEDIKQSELDVINHSDQEKLSKLRNYLMLWNAKSELFFQINKNNRNRNDEELLQLQKKIQELDSLNDSDMFFDSLYLKNHIGAAYCFYIGDFECSLNQLSNNIELFKSNPQRIKSDPNLYLSVLTNAVFIAHKMDLKQVFNQTLHELNTFADTYKIELTDDIELKLFSSASSLELSIMINSGEFEKAFSKLPSIEHKLESFGGKINEVRKAFIYFQIAYVHFGNGEYKESLKWINRILNTNTNEIGELMGYTNLFNLILHYELENERLLPYTLKAVERYYGKKKSDNGFEKLFLNYFKKIIKNDRQINRKELFYDLHEDILNAKMNQSIPMEYFRFDYWVESKAKNKDFASLFH